VFHSSSSQREMLAFERREREFRKQVKQEGAEELDMPELKKELYSLGEGLDYKTSKATQLGASFVEWADNAELSLRAPTAWPQLTLGQQAGRALEASHLM
jgi:hypothetical protein